MSTQNNHSSRSLKFVEALNEAVTQEMERDPTVFVMGLDVDDPKSILGSTSGMLQKFGSDRIFTTPLSEDAMTGVAIGAAVAGMRPIHVHIRVDFLMLCMNQLVNIAAKSHYMFGGRVKVPLVVRSIIGKSWGQGAQHSQSLQSMFMHVPGLKVVMPSNAYDAKGCMLAAIRDNNPVIFLEHRLLYEVPSFVPEEQYVVEFGKARVCTTGADLTIVGISMMQLECMRAHELLLEQGIQSEVIDPISLVPLDIETIIQSVKKTGRLLVVDNAWTNCGASAEIIARVAEALADQKQVQFKRIGFAPTSCPPTPNLEKAFYPDSAVIANKAFAMVHLDQTWEADASRFDRSKINPFRGPF
jgi:pyruvate/2-oxoglutarate/acetoin dehydrogenase E1 component